VLLSSGRTPVGVERLGGVSKMPWWHYVSVEELIKDLKRLESEDWRIVKKKRFKELAEKAREFDEIFHSLYNEETMRFGCAKLLGYALVYRPSPDPQITGDRLEEKVFAIVAWGMYNVFTDTIDIEEWLEKHKQSAK
jgi:hypothetical protein